MLDDLHRMLSYVVYFALIDYIGLFCQINVIYGVGSLYVLAFLNEIFCLMREIAYTLLKSAAQYFDL